MLLIYFLPIILFLELEIVKINNTEYINFLI